MKCNFAFCVLLYEVVVTQIVHDDITNELHQDENSHAHRGASINHLAFSSDGYPSYGLMGLYMHCDQSQGFCHRWQMEGDSGHT